MCSTLELLRYHREVLLQPDLLCRIVNKNFGGFNRFWLKRQRIVELPREGVAAVLQGHNKQKKDEQQMVLGHFKGSSEVKGETQQTAERYKANIPAIWLKN